MFWGVIYRLGYPTHEKKNVSRKIFEILFWLEEPKNDHSWGRGWGWKCPCLQIKVPLYFPIVFFFPRIACHFLELPFFPEVAFCFPEVSFYLSKLSFCFPERPTCIIRAAQRGNICLVLVLFPLRTTYWSTYGALRLPCVHIQAINKL